MKSTKRQIVLAALVVALGVAVYLNWVLTKAPDVTDVGGGSSIPSLSEVINTGTVTVDGQEMILTENAEEYFSIARISRQKTREESINTMQNTISSTDDQAVKLTAAETVLELAENIEIEGRIENLVMAKGFADCMAYVDNRTVSVIVATPETGLTAAQAAQIHDIALSESKVDVESVRIIEMK